MFTACLWTSALYTSETEETPPDDEAPKMDRRRVKQLFREAYPIIFHTILRLIREEVIAGRLAQEVFIELCCVESLPKCFDFHQYRELALKKAIYYKWEKYRMAG